MVTELPHDDVQRWTAKRRFVTPYTPEQNGMSPEQFRAQQQQQVA